MGDPLLTPALVGAAKVIDVSQGAIRLRESCKSLKAKVDNIVRSLKVACQNSTNWDASNEDWLLELTTILEDAKSVAMECNEVSSRDKWTRWMKVWEWEKFSSQIKEIEDQIDEARLNTILSHNIVQTSNLVRKVQELEVDFVRQPIPLFTVGVDKPFKRLKTSIMACNAKDKASHFGLHGRGGAGKTLLARQLNNDVDIQAMYGRGGILYVTVGQDARVHDLYRTMGTFLKDSDYGEYGHRSLEDQYSYLWNAFAKKRVLLILDDVWETYCNQREMVYWLNIAMAPGSATLITTRNKTILSKVNAKEEVVLALSDGDSWRLFCSHAFEGGIVSPSNVEDLAKKVCKECRGLPLALKVIGSAMLGKGELRDWRYAYKELKESKPILGSIVDDELYQRLKLSYNELKEDPTKICFLYSAAYPEDYEIPVDELCKIWFVEGLFGALDEESATIAAMRHLEMLVKQSMVEWRVGRSFIMVHDILRDLAIYIMEGAKLGECAYECCFQSGKEFGKLPLVGSLSCKRRMSFMQSSILEWPIGIEALDTRVCLFSRMSYDGTRLEGLAQFVLKLQGVQYLDLSRNNFNFHQITLVLQGMLALLILRLQECESLIELPESMCEKLVLLIELDLHMCKSLKRLPKNIGWLTSLIRLDLEGCELLEELPESICELKSLTKLHLDNCKSLNRLPKTIGGLTSLIRMNLRRCELLEELPESICELKSLTKLHLDNCKSLNRLPKTIGGLTSLIRMNLRRCELLEELPESICELTSLLELHLEGCKSLKGLPKSIGGLTCLIRLNLQRCELLEELPQSICELTTLHVLDLDGCKSLKGLPKSIGGLTSLIRLYLQRCELLKELPQSICELATLRVLDLEGCKSLKGLPKSIGWLTSLIWLNLRRCELLEELPQSICELATLLVLDLEGCKSLKGLPKSIGGLTSLIRLNLRRCELLEELPQSICELTSLSELHLEGCESLKGLPKSIGRLTCLTRLYLQRCELLEELPQSICEWTSLSELHLDGCKSLNRLPKSIGGLTSLTRLNLRRCELLDELPESICELTSLLELHLEGCKSLKGLPKSIGGLTSLIRLNLRRCELLEELPKSICELTSLLELHLEGCKSLKGLPKSIGGLTCLTRLYLQRCELLEELPQSICELTSLSELHLEGCKSLKGLPKSIGGLTCLTRLYLQRCELLEELPQSICELTSLSELHLEGCKSLKGLPKSIGGLTSLTRLNLRRCELLEELPENICELTSLSKLHLEGCESLKGLPKSIGGLTSLTRLNLRRCELLEELPQSICELTSLLELHLEGCKSLKGLPKSIGGLTCLTRLYLQRCELLEELPQSICELTSLSELHLEGCKSLKGLPKNIGGLTCLIRLYLQRCELLEELPQSICELGTLHVLDLGSCKSLKGLSKSIGWLTSLIWLNLRRCELLEELPQSICELATLHVLDLDGCKSLNRLPKTIGRLTSLTRLNLRRCELLDELPESICELTSLLELHLEGCKSLKGLPKSIGGLTSLIRLNLRRCELLEELPESICELTSLLELHLEGCKSLKGLPKSIGGLTPLIRLYLEECELLEELPESVEHIAMGSYGSAHKDNVCYETQEAVASSSNQGRMEEHVTRSVQNVRSKDLISGRLIGKGPSSIVYETKWGGKSYARKDFLRVPRDIFEREAAALVGLDHPNVLQTYCWTVDEGSCSLVLELMDDDLLDMMQKRLDSQRKKSPGSDSASQKSQLIDLHKFIKDRQNSPRGTVSESSSAAPLLYPFDTPEALRIILQVAEGMKFLHDKGIVHGDLKPKNILVTSRGRAASSSLDKNMAFKVADFGLVGTKMKSRTLVSRQARRLEMVRWRAPELLNLSRLQEDEHESSSDSDWDSSDQIVGMHVQNFTFMDMARADVYNFGLTCSQILNGEEPYSGLGVKDLMNKVTFSGMRPKLPPEYPDQLSDLIKLCLGEKTARPSFQDILNELNDLQASLTWTGSPMSTIIGHSAGHIGSKLVSEGSKVDQEETVPIGNKQHLSNCTQECYVTVCSDKSFFGICRHGSRQFRGSNTGRAQTTTKDTKSSQLPGKSRLCNFKSGEQFEQYEQYERMSDTDDEHEEKEDISILKKRSSGSKGKVDFEEIMLKDLRRFSFHEIEKLTDHFSDANAVGLTGTGEFKLFAGRETRTGARVVVKMASRGLDPAKDFYNEMTLLSRVHHNNVVGLVGVCAEDEPALVYDDVVNGSVKDWLHGSQPYPPLDWYGRLKIALGAARGLAYLHDRATPIIHRDVKSYNILLDEKLNTKIAHFGLALLATDGADIAVESSPICGTPFYIDPEYLSTGYVSTKSDVYGFGMVLLEVVIGKPPVSFDETIRNKVGNTFEYRRGDLAGLRELLDPAIAAATEEDLEKFVTLACSCRAALSSQRPSMRKVVQQLESLVAQTHKEPMQPILDASRSPSQGPQVSPR